MVRLKLLGALGWNLERGPISNEEEGAVRNILFWDLEHLNRGGAPGLSPLTHPP